MELSRPVVVQHLGHLTLTLDFQGQILKMLYLRNGRADWWKGCESIKCYNHFVTYNVSLTHDIDLGFSRSNIEKVLSQEWDGRLTWNERDVSREDVTHTLWLSTLTSNMTLTLYFKGQILKKLYIRNGMAEWHGMKRMCVDKVLGPRCDFQLSPHPWPWPWIFKVKFWKSLISGIGWPIDMERKGCESIEC